MGNVIICCGYDNFATLCESPTTYLNAAFYTIKVVWYLPDIFPMGHIYLTSLSKHHYLTRGLFCCCLLSVCDYFYKLLMFVKQLDQIQPKFGLIYSSKQN